MNRYRFKANVDDPRPMNFPLPHPYWITGYGEHYSTVVAYGDDESYILKNWPEAEDIDHEEATQYEYSTRFPKPTWLK